MNLGQPITLRVLLFLHLFQKEPLRISGMEIFYRLDVLPATQPSVLKH